MFSINPTFPIYIHPHLGRKNRSFLDRVMSRSQSPDLLSGSFWASTDVPLAGSCLGFGGQILTRWWFQFFFMFIPTWGNDPI